MQIHFFLFFYAGEKVKFQMKHVLIFLLVIIAFSPQAISYPQEQLKQCIASEKKNINLKGASGASIQNYCDCALELIVDKSEEFKESGYKCAVMNLQ